MELREFELLFKALSDKQRLRILALLSGGPLPVQSLKNVLHVSMSTVSQHLTILRYAGFVQDDKQGRWVYYSIPDSIKKGATLHAKIFKELAPHFKKEETFVFDRKLLEKQSKPDFSVKDKK